jgi:hypothetical protein
MRQFADRNPTRLSPTAWKPRPAKSFSALSRPALFYPSLGPALQKKSACACGGGCPRCQTKPPLQTKLAISQPGDMYEREADRVADEVMRMPAPSIQRECASCTAGGTTCAKCGGEKEEWVRRKAEGASTEVSSAREGLDDLGAGQPLDSATRNFFEPRFGYDFGHVRVHMGAEAAESARTVNALAYTVGRDVVFGQGQYAAGTDAGNRLLAHELAHVTQQVEGTSTPTVYRLVSSLTRCPPDANGAPADVETELAAMDARAQEIAATVADLTSASPPAAETLEAYENRFGLPPAVGSGFLNRLTGRVARSQEAAVASELAILTRRYRMVARMFTQRVVYRCGAGSFGGCTVSVEFCNENLAGACRGVGAIFLCPDFWTTFPDTDSRAAVLVHEAFHANFGTSNPRQTGEIGDEELRGAGRNFVIANCYEGFAADLAGIGFPEGDCPAAP